MFLSEEGPSAMILGMPRMQMFYAEHLDLLGLSDQQLIQGKSKIHSGKHWCNKCNIISTQLFYLYTFLFNFRYGSVPSTFAMDDVACTGRESNIRNCRHNTRDNCGGSEGAGVVCNSGTATHILNKI